MDNLKMTQGAEPRSRKGIRPEVVSPVAMLSKEEAAEALLCSPANVDKFRTHGLLKGIKTGNGIRYSQRELLAFQERFAGMDISGEKEMIEAARAVGVR